jgi:hypothetical protein
MQQTIMLAAASADVACAKLCGVTDRDAASSWHHLGHLSGRTVHCSCMQLYGALCRVLSIHKALLRPKEGSSSSKC